MPTYLHFARLGALSAISFALALAVHAQNPPADSRLQQIEQQLRDLTRTIEELRKAQPSTNATASPKTNDPIFQIRDEGLNRSQVAQTLSYLTDVIGPRLSGSPGLKRANEWTRDKLAGWGLVNSHLEPWGPFGTGWSLKRFSMQVIEPQTILPIAYPKAWSPGLNEPVTGALLQFNPKGSADLDKYKGKLKGAIVLWGDLRETKARWEPPATRQSETNLLRLANAGASSASTPTRSTNRNAGANSRTNAPGTNQPPAFGPGVALRFLMDEGAAVVLTPSTQGDGGTLFVASAQLPRVPGATNSPADAPRVWSTNAPATLPQVMVATEDFNRFLRMLQQGEKLTMTVDLQVQFHRETTMVDNTIAEIPGTDLKDQLVMLGAHLDSWHSATGATDNGAGVASVMEAVRILKALDLKPRRTIRIALWTGEEQGLLGSKAYVSAHFGYYTNVTNSPAPTAGKGETNPRRGPRPERKLIRQAEYEHVSSYFNLDNGTGKIRGVHLQGNEKVRSLFRGWLQPFADLGAETLTLSDTGGTDHLSFDAIGLPGFQFIQDPIEYGSRTHHSNQDGFDRIQPDDLKQAATIIAAFVYNAAMAEEKLPRKKTE